MLKSLIQFNDNEKFVLATQEIKDVVNELIKNYYPHLIQEKLVLIFKRNPKEDDYMTPAEFNDPVVIRVSLINDKFKSAFNVEDNSHFMIELNYNWCRLSTEMQMKKEIDFALSRCHIFEDKKGITRYKILRPEYEIVLSVEKRYPSLSILEQK